MIPFNQAAIKRWTLESEYKEHWAADEHRKRLLDIIHETGQFDFSAAEALWHAMARRKQPVWCAAPITPDD